MDRYYQIDLIDVRGRCHPQYAGNNDVLANKAWNRNIKEDQIIERIVTDINPIGPKGFNAKLISKDEKHYQETA